MQKRSPLTLVAGMTKNADVMAPVVWRLQGDRWKLYDFFSSVAAGFAACGAGLGAA